MNFLSEIREGLGISWAALRANKMRSVLATLGIIIGILTVTLMGAAINGLNQAFIRNVSALGANVFMSRATNGSTIPTPTGETCAGARRSPLPIRKTWPGC